jgi:hypothetical protein
MPEVSRFFGISIRMYFDARAEVEIGIDPLTVLRGRFPRRALGMVLEWAAMHREELLDNWDRLHHDEAAERIDPLD